MIRSSRIRGSGGYVKITNRFGDVPLVETQPDGSKRFIVAPGQDFEGEILCCAHCQAMVLLNPERKRERGWCYGCNAYVCDKPGCRQECHPIERQVELLIKYPDKPIAERDIRGFPIFDLDRLESLHIPR